MGLHFRELREAPPVRFVAPDSVGGGYDRVSTGFDERLVHVPHPAVEYDVLADMDVGDALANGPDDSRRVTATDVEIGWIAVELLHLHHVERHAKRGPDVVVVDARGHDVDEHLIGRELRNVYDFHLKGFHRRAEPRRANQAGMHVARHVAQGRRLADLVEVLADRGAHRIPESVVASASTGAAPVRTSPSTAYLTDVMSITF